MQDLYETLILLLRTEAVKKSRIKRQIKHITEF